MFKNAIAILSPKYNEVINYANVDLQVIRFKNEIFLIQINIAICHKFFKYLLLYLFCGHHQLKVTSKKDHASRAQKIRPEKKDFFIGKRQLICYH